MNSFRPAVMVLVATLSGCVSSVTTNAYRADSSNNGVVYSLPMTRLKTNITYTIRKETRVNNGIPVSSTQTILIGKPVVLEPVVAPDAANTFVLSGDALAKNSRLDMSFKFAVNDLNLLTSLSSEITDQSPAVFEGLVGSGLSIARMAAAAGEELPEPLKVIGLRLEAINAEVVSLAAGTDPKKLEKMDGLVKEQQVLVSFAGKYRELNATKTEEREVAYAVVLDLAAFEWDAATGTWSLVVKAPGMKLAPDINDNDVPGVTIRISGSPGQHANVLARYAVPAGGEEAVLYRAPVLLRTRVSVAPSNVLVYDDYLPFAQAGPVNRVEARYKLFAGRKTTITFNSATGGLKEYGVDTGSTAEAAAKSLDASLAKTQTALTEIRKAQAAVASPQENRLAELTMQQKLAKAEADLIAAKRKLEQLKAAAGE